MRNAAGVLIFGLVLFATPTLGASEEAKSDEPPRGKPVTLRVGPGFDTVKAIGLREFLNDEGCPTTVTTEGAFIPDSIDVEINGAKPANFTSTGSAGSYARRMCLEDLE